MRRKIIILTALSCSPPGRRPRTEPPLLNTYAGTSQSFSKGAGSSKKPSAMSFKQTLKAQTTTRSKAAAVLTDIKVKIYGLMSNAKQFPTCSCDARW